MVLALGRLALGALSRSALIWDDPGVGGRRMLAAALRNAALRRVELAFLAFSGAEWAVWIAMTVFAYDRGGATTAGLVALAQLLPAAIVAPVAAQFGERYPAGHVLTFSYALQALAMGGTAGAMLTGAPAVTAYAGAAVAATAVTLTRPAQAALLPSLARIPDELTAANVLSGWVESTSMLAAPAAAGVLLAVSSPGMVFALMAALALVAALVVAPIRGLNPAPAEAYDALSLRALLAVPAIRLVGGVIAIEFVVVGALDVLYVVLAEAQLGRGGSWAGYLNAAFGAGGVAGVALTAMLIGRRGLARPLLAGVLAWALTFATLASVPRVATAFLLIAAGGAARTVVDVAARTLLQRTAPPHLVGRLFGLVEGTAMAALAVGSLLVPAFVALGGPRAACVALAGLLVASALVAGRSLSRIDAAATVPVVEIALLRSVPMLAPLAAPTVEALARGLTEVELVAGAELIRQGDSGDRYYVIAEGELDVTIDGVRVAGASRGDGVGELALLADVPRTATVTARTDVRAQALDREPFLRAVTGNDRSAAEAARLVNERVSASATP